jgi:hypothetical protein
VVDLAGLEMGSIANGGTGRLPPFFLLSVSASNVQVEWYLLEGLFIQHDLN